VEGQGRQRTRSAGGEGPHRLLQEALPQQQGRGIQGVRGQVQPRRQFETKRPGYFDEFNNPLTEGNAASKLYAGAYVHAKVEFYPLLRDDGNRINCAILGAMFAGEGEAFGGGSPVASSDDFSGMAKERANAADLL